jgi:hypothetical protein
MGDPTLRLGLGGKTADLFGGPVAPGDEDIPSRPVPEFAGFDFGLFVGRLHAADIVRRPGNIHPAVDLTLAVDHFGRPHARAMRRPDRLH